jgi:hypothetical protein
MLNFPNQSRVFDPTRRAVRFWGHDSAMEWSFFVTEDALRRRACCARSMPIEPKSTRRP